MDLHLHLHETEAGFSSQEVLQEEHEGKNLRCARSPGRACYAPVEVEDEHVVETYVCDGSCQRVEYRLVRKSVRLHHNLQDISRHIERYEYEEYSQVVLYVLECDLRRSQEIRQSLKVQKGYCRYE